MNQRDDLEVMRQQLLAMRAQVDAMLAMVGEPVVECAHPVEQRKYDMGTMGTEAAFVCGACGQRVTPGG